MKIPQPRTVPDIVKQFYSVISRPVRYASLFYTYYYLVEVENIRELRRDFEKIRDELYVAFFNYGVYSVANELMWFTESFDVFQEGIRGEDSFTARAQSENIEGLKEAFYDEFVKQGLKGRDIPRYLSYIEESFGTSYIDTVGKDIDYETVEGACIWLEDAFCIFSKPNVILSDAEKMFLLKGFRFGGGEPWSKIARTLLRRNKTKPTIFVDACWGMQHVTGSWLDRVERPGKEIYTDVFDTLSTILKWKAEGEMPRVFRYALDYEPSLIKYVRHIK